MVLSEQVHKSFGSTEVLKGIDLQVQVGQVVCIIGPSGSGKSTFLRCINHLEKINAGRLWVDGTLVGYRERGGKLHELKEKEISAQRREVGMVFQQFNLVKRLRVLDNVLVGRLAHLQGWRRWAALAWQFEGAEREIALRCLAHVGLLECTWQRADTLSGGQQQRVAIARVLAQAPDLILADEPIASLDVANAAVVMDTLRRVATETGLTVISTLHQVEAARTYADRVLGFCRGRLVFDGAPARLGREALLEIFGDVPDQVAPAPPEAAPALGAPQWALTT